MSPSEVICHGDFAPYNCVFDGEGLTGVIDFNTAHRPSATRFTGSPRSPIPVARWCFGSLDEQAARVALFCDAYGLDDRSGLVDAVCGRLLDLVDFMRARAASG